MDNAQIKIAIPLLKKMGSKSFIKELRIRQGNKTLTVKSFKKDRFSLEMILENLKKAPKNTRNKIVIKLIVKSWYKNCSIIHPIRTKPPIREGLYLNLVFRLFPEVMIFFGPRKDICHCFFKWSYRIS